MGKVNQLGTLDEVLALCEVDKRITPCIDFGHLYARSLGTQFAEATAAADYAALLDTLAGAGWGMSVRCSSTRIFPALPTPRAARSAT